MTDALRHAEFLASAIVAGLSGSHPLDTALSDYSRRRDEDAQPMYALTHDLARLAPPPPPVAELLSALQDKPGDTSRYLGVMAGTVSVADFFGPANLARITGTALAA
jgi:2-polyprenyl-6-methoxyphenol hydroxylase-like FAD-dependent oxidoreductase